MMGDSRGSRGSHGSTGRNEGDNDREEEEGYVVVSGPPSGSAAAAAAAAAYHYQPRCPTRCRIHDSWVGPLWTPGTSPPCKPIAAHLTAFRITGLCGHADRRVPQSLLIVSNVRSTPCFKLIARLVSRAEHSKR